MYNKLTGPQRMVLGFLKDHARKHGRPPTGREINRHFKWTSPNASRQHLHALQRKGYIRIVPNIARGIELL